MSARQADKQEAQGRVLRHTPLLLTLALHVAAVLAIANSTGIFAERKQEAPDKMPLKVSLISGSALTESAVSAMHASTTSPGGAAGESAENRGNGTARQAADSVVIAQPPGPHYFRLSELSEKPILQHDAVTDMVVRVPGLPPQPVILRLLISDEGAVDRVLVEDSYLRQEIEQQVTEAFSRLRFAPGKIDGIAVRSQMRIEARLETMVHRLPDVAGTAG